MDYPKKVVSLIINQPQDKRPYLFNFDLWKRQIPISLLLLSEQDDFFFLGSSVNPSVFFSRNV